MFISFVITLLGYDYQHNDVFFETSISLSIFTKYKYDHLFSNYNARATTTIYIRYCVICSLEEHKVTESSLQIPLALFLIAKNHNAKQSKGKLIETK